MDFFQYPWGTEPAPVATVPPTEPPPKPRGRRPASAFRSVSHATAATPDWLYHHLTVSGPADGVGAFAAAARGSGVIPWRLDFSDIEETVFNLAVSQPPGRRTLTVEAPRYT